MSKLHIDDFMEKTCNHLMLNSHQRAKLRKNNRRFETNRKKKSRYHMAKQGIGTYWLKHYKREGHYTGETRTCYTTIPVYEDAEREIYYIDQKGEEQCIRYTYKKQIGEVKQAYTRRLKKTSWEDIENPTRANRYYISGNRKEAKRRMNRKIRRNKYGEFKGSSFKKYDDIWIYVD